VEILTDYPERLELHSFLFLGNAGSPDSVQRYRVERLRQVRRGVLLKLEGCEDRNMAEELRGMFVQIPREDAVPLEAGEYYLYQLIGIDVETDRAEKLGRIVEVIDTGANDVYVVQGPSGELLLPAIEEVVQDIDLEAGRLVVRLPPGLRAETA
jgi:16S rRNA processing protein RimM